MAVNDSEIQSESKIPYCTNEAAVEDAEDQLPANGVNLCTAVVDVFVALLPLYFVGFAIAAFIRNGTLANSARNITLFQMVKINPTVFPILFTLIFAKFLKAIANWKLERGITVGSMQHLLGSRSLISAILTPFKLRTLSIMVPVLIFAWIFNPVGGQLSLRTITRASHFEQIETEFSYSEPGSNYYILAAGTGAENQVTTINLAFNTALISPESAKNGTQDIFGNLHIPMVEFLQSEGKYQDEDGWFYTAPQKWDGLETVITHALEHALDIQAGPPKEVLYASLIGVPFRPKAVKTKSGTNLSQISTIQGFVQELEHVYFGDETVATTFDFAFETSYMYADCSFAPSYNVSVGRTQNGTDTLGNPTYTDDDTTSVLTTSRFSGDNTNVSSNYQGLMMGYDGNHTLNSTTPRMIGIESWITRNNDTNTLAELSQASCKLTTTYVEVGVHCYAQNNCTVSQIRASKQVPTWPAHLTVLDGISGPYDFVHYDPSQAWSGQYNRLTKYPVQVAPTFFDSFVNTTSAGSAGAAAANFAALSPLETYLLNTSQPYSDNFDTRSISVIGNDLFSRRMTQLINTYWTTSVLPFEVVNGLQAEAEGSYSNATGQTTVETTILHCNKVYTSLLIVISLGLVALGLAAAYLEAIRRGPDVLDDFVNALRHSPYVHQPMGPSMEDGKDIVQRLKSTVVQMGDVRPERPVGYVAIGTPNDRQRVDRLDLGRKYV